VRRCVSSALQHNRRVRWDAAPASVDHALVSPGRPLELALQHDMGQHFGYDFSRVRVHTGASAEESAREVNAHAYTVGHDIVLGGGQRGPQTSGRRTLAHELTHVMQQESGIGPQLQRQSKPDVNKSAEFIEETYRSGARRLNDPALSRAANDVRLCRELGGKYVFSSINRPPDVVFIDYLDVTILWAKSIARGLCSLS
jgi:hypothetical protein